MATTIKRLKLPRREFRIKDNYFQLPVQVTSQCPVCGKSVKMKLADEDWLKYPTIGAPIELKFMHYFEKTKHTEGEDHEWIVRVILDFTLTLAPGQT
jgi:hypothetical protein